MLVGWQRDPQMTEVTAPPVTRVGPGKGRTSSQQRNRSPPQPFVLASFIHQLGPGRVPTKIFHFLRQTIVRPQNVVEGFILPHRTAPAEQQVHSSSRSALNGSHDIGETEGPTIAVPQWSKYQVDVIRHDDGRIQINAILMSKYAAVQNLLSCSLWQYPSLVATERYENRPVILLNMRKRPPIAVFVHGHVRVGAGLAPSQPSAARPLLDSGISLICAYEM
jgi:hypothetical protein